LTHSGRQGGDLVGGLDPLPVQRLEELLCAVTRFIQIFHKRGEFGEIETQQSIGKALSHAGWKRNHALYSILDQLSLTQLDDVRHFANPAVSY
jgi:hypothetical protein